MLVITLIKDNPISIYDVSLQRETGKEQIGLLWESPVSEGFSIALFKDRGDILKASNLKEAKKIIEAEVFFYAT